MSKERLGKLQKWILKKCLDNTFLHRNQAREFYGKKLGPGNRDRKPASYNLEWSKKEGLLEEKEIDVYGFYKVWDEEQKKYIRPKTGKKEKAWVFRDDLIATKAMEVSISRCFNALVVRGLLERIGKWGKYYLTERGFVKVNNQAKPPGGVYPSVNNKRCPAKKTSVNNKEVVDKSTILNYKDYKAKVDEVVGEKKRAEEARRKRLKRDLNPSPEQRQKAWEVRMAEAKLDKKFTRTAIFEVCCEDCKKRILKLQDDCGIGEVRRLRKELHDTP